MFNAERDSLLDSIISFSFITPEANTDLIKTKANADNSETGLPTLESKHNGHNPYYVFVFPCSISF